jgi:valyl-tRNA synthetase
MGPKETRPVPLAEGQVQIAPVPADQAETVDLSVELADEVAQVHIADPSLADEVKGSLDKLRKGTKEGLSAQDHKDLGVAYMQMGLVDDAVREFKTSESLSDPGLKPAGKVRAKPAKKAKRAAKAKAKRKAPKKADPKKRAKAAPKKTKAAHKGKKK